MNSKPFLNRTWSGRVNHLNIGGTSEATVVKFCTQVGYIKSQHSNDKSSLKGAWSGSHDPFSILTSAIISPEQLKQETPNFLYM